MRPIKNPVLCRGNKQRQHSSSNRFLPLLYIEYYMDLCMDEWTIKTPNPICRLFFFDLLTDFAAFCLTDFIDWRYIHSWLVFSTQLVNCCPHGRRNNICVLLPLYGTFSLTFPPPSPFPNWCTVFTDSVGPGGGGWRGVELCCRSYSAAVLHSVSDQT